MCWHFPNNGEHKVRYYCSDIGRENRKKQNEDERTPLVLESDGSSKERLKNWARLIPKSDEVDALTRLKCSGKTNVLRSKKAMRLFLLAATSIAATHPPILPSLK